MPAGGMAPTAEPARARPRPCAHPLPVADGTPTSLKTAGVKRATSGSSRDVREGSSLLHRKALHFLRAAKTTGPTQSILCTARKRIAAPPENGGGSSSGRRANRSAILSAPCSRSSFTSLARSETSSMVPRALFNPRPISGRSVTTKRLRRATSASVHQPQFQRFDLCGQRRIPPGHIVLDRTSWYPSTMKDRRRPFTTTLPLSVLEELTQAMNDTDRTASDILEEALRAYFNPPKNS